VNVYGWLDLSGIVPACIYPAVDSRAAPRSSSFTSHCLCSSSGVLPQRTFQADSTNGVSLNVAFHNRFSFSPGYLRKAPLVAHHDGIILCDGRGADHQITFARYDLLGKPARLIKAQTRIQACGSGLVPSPCSYQLALPDLAVSPRHSQSLREWRLNHRVSSVSSSHSRKRSAHWKIAPRPVQSFS